jgi:hypothetical protein
VYVDAQAVFELNYQIGGCMRNEHYGFRRSISFALSVCLTFSGFPLREALAEGEMVNSMTGSGGSISISFTAADGVTPISKESLKPGDRVCMHASAHTATGDTVKCANPSFRPIQGITGDQLRTPDANGCMEIGNNFGTAEVAVQCNELPGIEGKTQVANVGGLMTPAEKAAAKKAAAEQAAEAVPQISGAQAALIGAGLGLGVVGLVVAAVPVPSTSSSSSCPCASGKYYVNGRCQTCPQADNSCYGSPSPGYKYCP